MARLFQGFINPAGNHAPAPAHRVAPIHVALHGRLRLKAHGLYRSEAARRRIEDGLSAHPGVKSVSANPLTGNVLILYVQPASPDGITAALERLLEGKANPATLPGASRIEASRPHAPRTRQPEAHQARAPETSPPWHALDNEEVLVALGSSRHQGLTRAGVAQAHARHGPNVLPQPPIRSPWAIFLGQFNSLPVALLLGSAVLSVFTGGLADAAIILGVVLINAGIGHVTEIQTERAIQSLAETRRQRALVLREGSALDIDATGLVPGDILMLVPGSAVTADVRLIEVRNLTLDESALTGESLPSSKIAAPLDARELPLGDRINMAYMGTVVTGGSGLGVVVATGRHTQIGAIQAMVSDARPPQTPMQRQLDRLGRQMVWLSAGTCGLVFLVGLLRGRGMLQMLSSTVSLAVAAVPEGLPTVATTTLAIGVKRMRRHHILVRQLDAVETLGAAQIICLDKTGTLTLNRMSVLALQAGDDAIRVGDDGLWCRGARLAPHAHGELMRLVDVAVLCNEVQMNGAHDSYVLNGSATESALVEFALACGVDVSALRLQYPLHALEHRSEGRNYMRSLHRRPDGSALLAVKGSPAEVLSMCRWWLVQGVHYALTEDDRAAILDSNDRLAGDGLRVLGFAYCLLEDGDPAAAEGNLVWLGLTGLADPVRRGVSELMGLFHQAGIRTVMITGDQTQTAYAIGKALGLSDGRPLEIMDSVQLERITPGELPPLVEKVDVFARVSPANKLQIVQGLQRAGKVVAMTGDGINDGPALRAADIGVAMGASGTDTARSVADVVIEDDELQTMIVAVSEGRTIYNNIRKSVHFLASTNLSEILVMLSALATGMGQPLNTMQLLWINLLTDIFPALALAVEPPEPDVLRVPPRDPAEAIIRPADLGRYGRESLALTGGVLASYGYGLARHGPGPRAGTMAFMTLVLGQFLHVLSCRSDTHGLFTAGSMPPNPQLKWAIGASAGLQALAVTVPGLRGLLGTTPLGVFDTGIVLGGAALPFLLNEAAKAHPALLQMRTGGKRAARTPRSAAGSSRDGAGPAGMASSTHPAN